MKKGFAKIALQTEEANDFKLGIQLIPLAISYTDYEQIANDYMLIGELYLDEGNSMDASEGKQRVLEEISLSLKDHEDCEVILSYVRRAVNDQRRPEDEKKNESSR